MKLFPPRDFQRDTYSILGSKFAYFILESIDGNILASDGLQELKRLHQTVKGIIVSTYSVQKLIFQSPKGLTFESVCIREMDACLVHPLLLAVEDDPSFAPLFFRYPILRFGDLYVDNALVFGGVKLDEKVRRGGAGSGYCMFFDGI